MNDPEHIAGWLRLDEHITTSGQPSEDELAEIKALGVEHVVNLALHDHEKSLADEHEELNALGVEYIHIPVVFSEPTEDDFDQFCREMGRLSGKKVHVHCIVNARVSAFFYRYRRDRLDWDEEKARADMNKIWDPADWKEVGKPWVKFLEK